MQTIEPMNFIVYIINHTEWTIFINTISLPVRIIISLLVRQTWYLIAIKQWCLLLLTACLVTAFGLNHFEWASPYSLNNAYIFLSSVVLSFPDPLKHDIIYIRYLVNYWNGSYLSSCVSQSLLIEDCANWFHRTAS